MSDHHVRWSSFQWWTSLSWSYLLYDSCSTFRSQCSEAISAYARLVKFNPSILHVQNWLAPVVCERRAYHTRSSRGVSAQRTFATVHTQGEHLYFVNFSEWSSYNATINQCKIRCMSVGTTPMGSQESLLWLAGRGVLRRADQTDSTWFIYPGSGREDA